LVSSFAQRVGPQPALSTFTGLLDFNRLNIAVEPEKIAQYLADLQAIPDFFSEEQVHFVGDKAIYVNATEAEAAIKPTAKFMLANPNFTALLVGTTDRKVVLLDLTSEMAQEILNPHQ
jgi:hypothetical protein